MFDIVPHNSNIASSWKSFLRNTTICLSDENTYMAVEILATQGSRALAIIYWLNLHEIFSWTGHMCGIELRKLALTSLIAIASLSNIGSKCTLAITFSVREFFSLCGNAICGHVTGNVHCYETISMHSRCTIDLPVILDRTHMAFNHLYCLWAGNEVQCVSLSSGVSVPHNSL